MSAAVPTAGRAPLPVVAAIVAGAYALWLHVGTRRYAPNPPMAYEDFRTFPPVTFASVREALGFEQAEAYEQGQYMFVSRGTVLGRMHQLKREQYDRYLDHYEEGDEDLPF